MESLAKKVEKALNEVKKPHIVALEHAVEISPYIHNRSIGANAIPVRDTESEKYEGCTPKVDSTKTRSPFLGKTLKKCLPRSSDQDLHNLQNLDFQTVNSSMLMREAEEGRKRSVRQEILEKQDRDMEIMQDNFRPIEKHNQEELRKWLERKQQNDLLILQKAEQQSAIDLREHNRQLESVRLQAQRQLQRISYQGISQYQLKFRNKYEVVVNLLMSIDKASLMSCNEYNRKLKDLIQMFEQLICRIKSECGPVEVRNAESLCTSLVDLEQSILGALKQEQEKREQAAREQRRQEKEAEAMVAIKQQEEKSSQEATEQQQPASQQNVPVVENKTPTMNDEPPANISNQFVSSERLGFYTKINSFYQEKVERVKVLQSDESMKKYRFDCQKSINIPVNAISAVSQQHIQDKYEKLLSFVTSQPTLGKDYCILLMAKKFVGQGETTISSNPQAAFPVASVIVSLWKHIPEFGQLFLAYCFKECPFLVPYFIPQKKGQSIEEYSKVLGYRMTDGQLEKQDMYLKRHAGIARLYAAVMVTNGRQQDGPSHPYGLEHAWRWLTNILALAPLPDMSATLIMEILQIVGSDLWSSYGRQFLKLLLFIQQHYFPKLSSVDAGGPKARLELLLGKFLREGQIQKPTGMLPKEFW